MVWKGLEIGAALGRFNFCEIKSSTTLVKAGGVPFPPQKLAGQHESTVTGNWKPGVAGTQATEGLSWG